MMASPPVMASLTVAVEMFSSSSQMEIVPLLAASSVVASAKAAAPVELNFSWTTQPSVSLYAALAEVTSSPLRISSPVAVEPLRKTILAVVPISSIAVWGLKSDSSVFQGKRTMIRSLLLST